MRVRVAYFLTGGLCGVVLGSIVAIILLGWAMCVDKDREARRDDERR